MRNSAGDSPQLNMSKNLVTVVLEIRIVIVFPNLAVLCDFDKFLFVPFGVVLTDVYGRSLS